MLRALLAFLSLVRLIPAQNAAPVREATAPLPGVRLFYIDSGGTGQPVIFLHAASGSTRVWEHQIRAFTSVGYRFIAFDRRGWGRTVIESEGPQPGTAAEDLESLREYLHLASFHLVGTAAGGIVAVDYALAFPERLRSLVVANSIVGISDVSYRDLSRKLRPPEFESLPPHLRELGPSYRAANPQGTERWLELEHSSRAQGPRVAAQPTKNRVTFAMLEAVTTPTLLIAGGADLYAPPPVQQLFAKRIKHSELVTIPEAGHSAFWETPDIFNQTVLRFFSQHAR